VVAENPEREVPKGKPSPRDGGLGEGVPASAGAGEALTANLFTMRERGSREEVKVELAVLKRGYSVYFRLRTFDQGLALRVYERLREVVRELEVEGFESPKLSLVLDCGKLREVIKGGGPGCAST